MFVNVDQRGGYHVAGEPLTINELHPLLKATWVNNPGRVSVVIHADKECDWKHVVAVMDACNKANIRDYRITTLESGG